LQLAGDRFTYIKMFKKAAKPAKKQQNITLLPVLTSFYNTYIIYRDLEKSTRSQQLEERTLRLAKTAV